MNCKIVVNCVVRKGDSVLLVRFGQSPDQQTGWFAPNELLQELEHPDEACKRIITDQVRLVSVPFKFSHFESFRGRDKTWHLTIHYLVEVPSDREAAKGEGVNELEWFPLKALPPRDQVAHHGWALDAIGKAIA